MINGIIGKKLGMTQIFMENGTVETVTAIEAGPISPAGTTQGARSG